MVFDDRTEYNEILCKILVKHLSIPTFQVKTIDKRCNFRQRFLEEPGLHPGSRDRGLYV